jgi:anti-sigma factor RsiW
VGSSAKEEEQLLDLVLDGVAEPAQKQAFEQRLQDDSECRREFDFYSNFKQLTRDSLSQEKCPDLVKARLMKALQAEVAPAPAAKPRSNWGLGWVAAAAAACFSFVALRPADTSSGPLALSLSQDHSRCCARPVQSQPADVQKLAEQNFGTALPEIAQVEHLQAYDVRLCQLPNPSQPVIHMLCRDDQQRVISMYAMPSNRCASLCGSHGSPRIFETQEARVASWEHKGWAYSLVSRVPQEELASLAGSCSYGCPQALGQQYAQPLVPSSPGLMPQAIPASHHP